MPQLSCLGSQMRFREKLPNCNTLPLPPPSCIVCIGLTVYGWLHERLGTNRFRTHHEAARRFQPCQGGEGIRLVLEAGSTLSSPPMHQRRDWPKDLGRLCNFYLSSSFVLQSNSISPPCQAPSSSRLLRKKSSSAQSRWFGLGRVHQRPWSAVEPMRTIYS